MIWTRLIELVPCRIALAAGGSAALLLGIQPVHGDDGPPPPKSVGYFVPAFPSSVAGGTTNTFAIICGDELGAE